MTSGGVTSPRVRGEVDGAKRRRVRGRRHESELVETPPHPDPLPASGEREKNLSHFTHRRGALP
jgi:DNA helicase II / ATP-dependent DNA helicase PcrA